MKALASLWEAIAPGLGDHLWQSTLVLLVVGLLAVLLRTNHARTRYWLWLAASLKFLFPFSWLVALGSKLAWRNTVVGSPAWYVSVEQIAQPFTQSSATGEAIAHAAPTNLMHFFPAILIAVWIFGFLVMLCSWCARWRRISRTVEHAARLVEGREVEALRRLEPATGIFTQVDMRISGSTLEPGIFGVAKPVLLWPEGISQRLDDAQLEAVIAHELWHVRRRDNLAAVFHMSVEAIFWFHPLVWWVGTRLLDERERACDEEVLESGSERQTYAESILKVCEFCVGSPLPCVSGVTGADLKKRMVHIMSEHVARKLDFTRRLLLSVLALAAVAVPVGFGVLHATPSRAQSADESASTGSVESASIKPSALNTPTYAGSKQHMIRMMYGPDGFQAANVTLKALLEEAYQVQASQISGGPDWLDSAAFDVQVKLAKADTNAPPSKQQMLQLRQALQKLLAEHTSLVLHSETKTLPIYALEVGENGSKLRPSLSGDSDEVKGAGPVRFGHQQMRMEIGGNQVYGIGAAGISTDDLAQHLSRQLGTPVVNKTGLQGRYDFNLNWSNATGNSGAGDASSGNPGAPSLFTAVQEQLGLKLDPQNAPMQVLVIDRVEKPIEN